MNKNIPMPHPPKHSTARLASLVLLPAALLAAACGGAEQSPEADDVVVFNAHPSWFRIAGDEVLWAENAPGHGTFELRAAPRSGAPANGLEARRLGTVRSSVCAVGGDAVFCGAPDGVDQVLREGGESARFVRSGKPLDIAVDQDFVYWVTDASVDWASRKGEGAASVPMPDAPRFVRVLGGAIFVATTSAVYRIERASGAVTPLAAAEDFRGAFPEAGAEPYRLESRSGFVALEGKLGWLVGPSASVGSKELGILVEIPAEGGEAVVLAEGLSAPDLLAGDAEGYVWYEPRGAGNAGAILRLTPEASSPEVVAENAPRPAELVTSSGEIYWALAGDEFDAGAIRRAPR